MQTLSKNILHYGDTNYNHAVNYRHLYNAPITLNYGPKHGRTKYILNAGTSDHITLLQYGIFIYVINENSGLSYIGLQVINTELKEVEGEVFLNDGDIEDGGGNLSSGILELDCEAQLKILCEYL